MTWTAPRTWTTGEAVRARYFNTDVRDNMTALIGRYHLVSANESTTSTAYTDLATIGPSVTVENATKIFAVYGCRMTANTLDGWGAMAPDMTGANTVAASDGVCAHVITRGTTSSNSTVSFFRSYTALTAGQSTITMKYKSSNAAHTINFLERYLYVIGAG